MNVWFTGPNGNWEVFRIREHARGPHVPALDVFETASSKSRTEQQGTIGHLVLHMSGKVIQWRGGIS